MYTVELDEEDDSYETDFILDNNNNELRNRLLSLLMFANKIKTSTPFELWIQSPTDFLDIVSYWHGDNPDDKMSEISALLNRFADSIWLAAKSMLRKNYSPNKTFSPNSLIRILANQEYFDLPISDNVNSGAQIRDSIFISYAHEDEKYITELKPFLRVLERDCNIAYWYDKKIQGGDDWEEEIRKHMSRAKVALLLVSQDFIASDFIHNEELPELTKAAKNDGATLLWLPISHCTWESTSFADFQSAAGTNPNRPLSEMEKVDKDLVYKKLFREIKDAFNSNEHVVSASPKSAPIQSQSAVVAYRKDIIVSFLKENGQARVVDLCKVVGLSDGRVRILLRELMSNGIVKRVGSNRYVYYMLI